MRRVLHGRLCWQQRGRLRLVAAALLFCSTTVGNAHVEHFTPQQNAQLAALLNKGGINCCSTAEAAPVKDPDWGIANGHYWVFIDGERHRVPDDAVVVDSNPTSVALLWLTRTYNNGVKQGLDIKCFRPGLLS